MRNALPVSLVCSILLSLAIGVGCSHSKPTSPSAAADSTEGPAEQAVRATVEDERYAPLIQRDVNSLFFDQKRTRPGGLDAFSAERLAEHEEAMRASSLKSVRYFLENREFFDRVEDSGGGFRIFANGKRLTPFAKTKVGRRKLFDMDSQRVREAITNPCFTALEDCGEYSSDAVENTTLLSSWSSKYSSPDLASDREKLLREYVGALKRYEEKILKRVPKHLRAESKGAREASELIGRHRQRIEALIEKPRS